MNWKELGFNYVRTAENVRIEFKEGKWGKPLYTADEYISLHISAACLNYGLECFEGLKAFRGADGKVRLFRVADNARRMQASARKLCLPIPPEELFVGACEEIVRRNIDFVPPYETGATLYLRPILLGSQPCLGVRSVQDATLIIYASPVGPYFKEGIRPLTVAIDRSQDRSAPRGTGDIKAGGNYASSMLSNENAHELGYSAVIYSDSVEHKYIEECGAANFFGIKGNHYITPKSSSILPSITNRSLRQIAADMGMVVEERPVALAELPTFDEAGSCGTGVAISPIGKIVDLQTGERIDYGNEVGEKTLALYNALQDIQYGRAEDKHGWCDIVSD